MTANDVIKRLYKELQDCRKENGVLKNKIKWLEKSIDERNEKIENLISTIELVLGEDIIKT